MSTDPENEYFTDGLTEELINVLTYVPGLRVVARTSVFCFKNTSQDVREIGTRLNVETVLEGSVRKSGNQLRVTAQLIDVSTGYHLLSRTFPRELKDVFEVQEELAGAVVNEIMPERRRLPKPVARNYTADLELYNLYLKATFVLRNSFTGPRDSIAQFRQVLDRDPGYAPAWAELAWAYCMHAWFGFLPSDKAMSLGRESALKALALDDGLGIAHAMLGMTNAVLDWNWKEAEKHYRRAIEVQPGLAAAHQIYAYTCLMPQRRFQEALAATERALPLNPLDAVLNSSATFTFAVMGHHAAALRQQAINQEANPHHPVVFGSHGFALEVMGRFEEALAEYSNACNLTRRAPFPLGALGHLYAKTGNAGEAEQVLEEFLSQSDPDGVCVALVYVGLRKNSEAFQWMEKAMEARLPHVILIPHDPRFAPLYGDPRYQQILETMGLARAATA